MLDFDTRVKCVWPTPEKMPKFYQPQGTIKLNKTHIQDSKSAWNAFKIYQQTPHSNEKLRWKRLIKTIQWQIKANKMPIAKQDRNFF